MTERYQRDHTFGWTHGERLRHIYADHAKELEGALQHMLVEPNLADESAYLINRTRSLHHTFHGTPRNSAVARQATKWKRMTRVLDTPTWRPKPRTPEAGNNPRVQEGPTADKIRRQEEVKER